MIVSLVAFQIGWFAAVLGAARGAPWLGLVVVPMVVLLSLLRAPDWKRELLVALAAGAMGSAVDTALIAAGAFAPLPYGLPPPCSPLWMVMLWINQATALKLLQGRYLLGCALGAIGGPLAYLGGARLGAAALPSAAGLAIIGATWAAAFPALLLLSSAATAERSPSRPRDSGARRG